MAKNFEEWIRENVSPEVRVVTFEGTDEERARKMIAHLRGQGVIGEQDEIELLAMLKPHGEA